MKAQSQRGVALVITLIMLAVVTFMAITFLAVSRRERASVSVTEETTTARLMSEAALARARSETVARMFAGTNLLSYDLAVSTNFINPQGFDPAQVAGAWNPTNVNYDFRRNGTPLSQADRLQVIANLQLDSRPPVFVTLNSAQASSLDSRFYLDLNRNGIFDPSGLQPVLDDRGRVLGTNFVIGDPQWIGVLQRSDVPHSATNRFVGRYAYIILPAGRTLDWNFIHNNARLGNRQDEYLKQIGYYRNQGVGSWELNLGAFLYELNPNAYGPGFDYGYNGLGTPLSSHPFLHALDFLRYRYGTNYANLAAATAWFGNSPAQINRIRYDNIDEYANGPAFNGELALTTDNDDPTRPWPGSDNPQTFFTLTDLFDTNKASADWLTRVQRVQQPLRNQTVPSTFNRYTIYRMLDQIGMESSPANQDKLNLNYNNLADLRDAGVLPLLLTNGLVDVNGQARWLAANPVAQTNWFHATNLVSWTPVTFFTNAAARLFAGAQLPFYTLNAAGFGVTNFIVGDTLVSPAFAVTNIHLWPTNEYTPTVHRLLQVAVNLFDATTNRPATLKPYLPTVFRPTFGYDNTNIFVSGYVEVTNADFMNLPFVPYDLSVQASRNQLIALAKQTGNQTPPTAVVYDVPFLIGAKKGFPNFNEFSLLNVAQVTRKIELIKRLAADPRPIQTNLLYLLTLSNRFGLEAWNSYTSDYPRSLQLHVAGDFAVALSNGGFAGVEFAVTNHYATNYVLTRWPAQQFQLPITSDYVVRTNALYLATPRPHLTTNTGLASFNTAAGFYVPQWVLFVTNRFYYAVVDTSIKPSRLVDFVAIGGAHMNTALDLTSEFTGNTQLPASGTTAGEPPNVWVAQRTGTTGQWNPSVGIANQVQISQGNTAVSAQQWTSWSQVAATGLDKTKSIDAFRVFCGLSPLVYQSPLQRREIAALVNGLTAMQAPFSPTRKLYQEISWQVNDPLVHYLASDLLDPFNPPNDPTRTNAVRFAIPPSLTLTNHNLGLLNDRYRPWGGNPNQSTDRLAYDTRVKDAMIQRSDDWEFPTNKLPGLGWIGRVHRGTPWQTIYLKASLIDATNWYSWAGSLGTHPTNDWYLVDLFTTAPNDNAARGLLSVNQTNLAAWSAVLSGVSVLTNTTPTGRLRSNTVGFAEMLIQPSPVSWQLTNILAGINRTRQWETNLIMTGREVPLFQRTGGALGVVGRPFPVAAPLFQRMGRILATPELTSASPFINPNHYLDDAIMERIPQQILSLLRDDQPRFVVYSFGQTLREAPNSRYLGSGPFNLICTNYEIKAEYVTRTVIRLDGPLARPRAVIESQNVLNSE